MQCIIKEKTKHTCKNPEKCSMPKLVLKQNFENKYNVFFKMSICNFSHNMLALTVSHRQMHFHSC